MDPQGGMVDHSIGILWRVLLAFGLAVTGGIVSASIGISHRRLCALISLAAGTLLGVTLFSILPEGRSAMRWWEIILALASGYVVFLVISKYVYHVCPACAASHFDEATTHRFQEIATALIVALGIHSTMDGIAVAAGTEAIHHESDLSILLAVCVHKVPEGLALGALLIGAGFARARAVLWVAVVEATTLLGGAIGWFALREVSSFWVSAVLAHADGGFVFLATHAVFGELVKHSKATVLIYFAGGIGLIGLLNVLVRVL